MRKFAAAFFVAATILSCDVHGKPNPVKMTDPPVNGVAVSFKNPIDKDNEELGKYILTLMNMADVDLSTIRKNVLVRSIVSVSGDVLENLEQRKEFAVLIAIESKFKSSSKSTAGAVGLTQVMPQYAAEFAKRCGAGDVRREDLDDINVNLLIGACRFRALLEAANGNVTAALVVYNAGVGSNQLKQLKKLHEMVNKETPNYVTKFHYMHDEADIEMKYTKIDLDKGDDDESDDSKN